MNAIGEKRIYKQLDLPKLYPGTVLIEATVIKVEDNINSLFLVVDRILGSGHSTPNIAVGEKINVSVNNEVLEGRIKDKDSLKVILKYSLQKVGKKRVNSWKIINIK